MIIKIKQIIFLILLSLLCVSQVNSEIVKKIEILGNKRVSDETIKIYGEIKINQDYSPKEVNGILNNLYSTNFFKDVKISLNNGILKIVIGSSANQSRFTTSIWI